MDSVELFLELFGKGKILEALQVIISAPDCQYEKLSSIHKDVLHAVINYADAAVSISPRMLIEANKYLRDLIPQDRVLWLQVQPALSLLKYEWTLLNFFCSDNLFFETSRKLLYPEVAFYIDRERNGLTLKLEEIQSTLNMIPIAYRDCLHKQMIWSQNIKRFCQHKPAIASYLKFLNSFALRPWHVFHYTAPFPSKIPVKVGGIPLVFLKPYDGDYQDLLSEFKERQAIFVFEDRGTFFQMLQFPAVVDLLSSPKHLIYLLDIYPNVQLQGQQWEKVSEENFQIVFAEGVLLKEVLDVFTSALRKCLQQPLSELKKDTDSANWLYAICKRFLFRIREIRYGKSRAGALKTWADGEAWMDPHKGNPPKDLPLGPPPKDYFGEHLQHLAKERRPRSLGHQARIKLAHIVPQIVEGGGHAPSRILDNLLTHYNRNRFDIVLISSERLMLRPMEYPFNIATSPHSTKRADRLLHHWENSGIKVYLANNELSYELTSKGIASILHHHQVDVAVYHGPDVINAVCTQMSDVPLQVFLEHGTVPQYPGFDQAILSTGEALDIYRDHLKNLGTQGYSLPFAVDVRMRWEKLPPTRESLGLPPNAFVMTTISNHLSARLGMEMCLAIAEILKRCPEAYYAPMGMVFPKDKEYFNDIFSKYGVNERVIFLGNQTNTGQCARVMQLYLNEFPFGSCLGMLDAMAAGCPVVTMYDLNGPQQARYGGSYFGIDRAVTTGSKEDYVELACRLIKDKDLYNEWSEHAQKQYAKHVDTEKYVAGFESIIEIGLEKTQSER